MTASPIPAAARCAACAAPAASRCIAPSWSRYSRPLNRYLRYEAGLGGRVRELAILATARELDSQFEWAAHEAEALREGSRPTLIDIIRHRRSTAGLAEADAIIIELGREIFGARKVTPETYARRAHANSAAARSSISSR